MRLRNAKEIITPGNEIAKETQISGRVPGLMARGEGSEVSADELRSGGERDNLTD